MALKNHVIDANTEAEFPGYPFLMVEDPGSGLVICFFDFRSLTKD